jgi:Domain of unknown function (DUF4115)
MPDSRIERVAFGLGLFAIVALAIALVPSWRTYAKSPAVTPRAAGTSGASVVRETAYRSPPSSYARTLLPPASASSLQTPAPSGTRVPPKGSSSTAQGTRLALAAARGDCWLEVRHLSATGKVVYVGTLAKGKSVAASGAKLWIRFGAPQNVDLKLNGKAVSIPSGTLDVLVTGAGIRAAA